MTDVSDKVIDRIRKLLALGTNNSNEHEAKIAMERAHRLLAEYNLSLADMTESEKASADPYMKDEQIFKERFRPYGRAIAHGIAKLYFCKMFYQRSERFDRYTFVGRATNVAIAKQVSEAVCATICAEAKAASKHAGFQTNFMSAASSRIHARCMALIKEAEEGKTKEEDNSNKNLPALRNTYLAEIKGAEDFMASEGITLVKPKAVATGGRGGYDGFVAGAAAGNRVSLRAPLGAKGFPTKALK